MKIIKIELDNPNLENGVEIIPLSDLHIGDSNFNKKEFLKVRDYIRDTENCYCILNGDLINNATRNSVSDIYSETMSPMQQIKVLVEYLEPIKAKILAGVGGNHCFRTFKESGIDIMAIVMTELGLSDRYAEESYYIFLRFGNFAYHHNKPICYTIYGLHGSGGGRTPGAKLNKLVSMSNICFADLYIMSHDHEPMTTSLNFYLPEYGNKVVIERTMEFMMTNSFLNYAGYGEKSGYRPSSRKIVKAKLSAKERFIEKIS